jgi:histidinol dehydrogenase
MIRIIKQDDTKAIQEMLSRSQFQDDEVNRTVEEILRNVYTLGDVAIRSYTEQFDRVRLENFKVTQDEIKKAFSRLDPLIIEDLNKAKNNIEIFHQKQMPTSYRIEKEDIILEQRISAIENVGIYVPGGTAAYPSTVLMNAVPAKIAGSKKIIMITPPDSKGQIKDSLLVAASISGVDEIYKVGGAQGIAGLAYGTETIPKVDLIVGPGNIYVAMAKKMVMGKVGIDMIAGPSEILIIADEKANPAYIAADLMGQAEHDPEAAAICLTTSLVLAQQIKDALEQQIKSLKRKEIIQKSFDKHGAIIITNSLTDAINFANIIAPEHLELLMENPFEYVDQIKHAGAIFVGPYTPEPVGDYFAGTNHTLPTSGTARFSSALSVTDFIKKTSVVYYTKKALDSAKDAIIRLANEEGLTAHANAIQIRYSKEE